MFRPLTRIALLALLTAAVTASALPERVAAQEGVLTGDPAKAAALLTEARKALGGADKIAAVKTLQMKGNFRRTAGNNQLEGDLDLLVQLPDHMKRIEDMSLPGGGPAITITQVLNGTEVWDENSGGNGRGFVFFGGPGGPGGGGFGRGGGGGGRGAGGPGGPGGPGGDGQAGGGQAGPGGPGGRGQIDPERLRQAQLRQRQGDLSRILVGWLLTSDAPAAWVATAESPEGKADVIEFKPEGQPAMRLFLDAGTHMPLMLTWQGAAPQLIVRGGRRGQPGGQPGGAPDGAAPAGPAGPAGPDGQGAPGAAPASAAGAPAGPPAGTAPGADAPGARPDGPRPDGPRRGGPGGPQATINMTFADYKTVNGVKLPHLVTRGVNGQTNEEWTISSYKVNPSVKAGTFEQKK